MFIAPEICYVILCNGTAMHSAYRSWDLAESWAQLLRAKHPENDYVIEAVPFELPLIQ